MKISIIMPVYNSELYLSEAIESILLQSYKNFELIIINDGSTDNSENIIKKYTTLDNRIKLITIKNGGVSNARNVGLNIASGEYVIFVDSDDIVEYNFLEELSNGISENDICICGYKLYYENRSIDIVQNDFDNDIVSLQKSIFTNNNIGGFCCNKIFKLSIINEYNIRFNKEIKICEDMLFVMEYITKISKCCYLPKALYRYRMRKSSATMKKNYKKVVSELTAYEKILQLNISEEIKEYVQIQYLKTYYKNRNYFSNLECCNKEIFQLEEYLVKKIMNLKQQILFYFIKYKFYKFINYYKQKNDRKKYFE